ncbi:MAG: dihydroorotase [Candidatus Magasanikbacteria bacterium]
MIIKTCNNQSIDIDLPPETNAESLTALPALIDPHVHFRTPGAEHKEDWKTASKAAIAGGVTTVLDMPNNTPSCTSRERLIQKKEVIEKRLAEASIALRYLLYVGADKDRLDDLGSTKDVSVAIKVFMGSSTGDLLIDEEKDFNRVAEIAAKENMLVAVHAEDEAYLKECSATYEGEIDPAVHSKKRNPKATAIALERVINAARTFGTRFYVCHVSTKTELDMIREAKREGLSVYAEVTPHHLFLNEAHYNTLGCKAQMNPPLRSTKDMDALWEGIQDGTIDTIGTDHAPHTLNEKSLPYGEAPSGVPGIETLLPLLLDAHHNRKISLEKIVELTSTNPKNIFGLEKTNDYVLVDLREKKAVENNKLFTKCRWSPFNGWNLTGWPVYTVLKNKIYDCTSASEITQNEPQKNISTIIKSTIQKKSMRHIISLKEQSRKNILEILDIAQRIKAKRNSGRLTNYLQNKTLIMLFQKTSTRTRLSFEASMTELGGHSIFLDSRTAQFSLTDFADEIQAVMRFGHVLMFRAKQASDVELAASFNRIPVIDACSEKYHPAQALSDLLTMTEIKGGVENIKKITWLGIENNVSNTLMLMCAKLGIEVAIAAAEVDEKSVDPELNIMAAATGLVTRTQNLEEALAKTDFVHTDTWMNMEFFLAADESASGGESGKVKPEFQSEYERRKEQFLPYQINAELMSEYAPDAHIMHCMPLHVGYEISRDTINHPKAVILNQAENRLHAQKAMIMWLLEENIQY